MGSMTPRPTRPPRDEATGAARRDQEEGIMRDQGKLLTGLLVGAGLEFLLDPDRGARRRALVRDQAVRASHKLGDELDATTRDLRNRAKGSAAELRSRFRKQA